MMKIDKSELSKKIGQVKNIVPSSTTIDALKGVLYQNGYLIASNSELTIKAKIEVLQGEEMEPFIIPDKAFELINSLPTGEIELTVDKEVITLRTGKIKNQFKTLPANKFAYARDSIESTNRITISFDILKKAVSHVIYAVSSGANNQIMTGVYMHTEGKKLNFVGLDGHRIAWDCVDYDGELNLIIPKTAFEKMMKLDFTGNIEILHDANGALFKSAEYEVYTRLIQGEYYKYRQMFKTGDIFTAVERKTLLESINRARLCGTASDTAPVIFDMKDTTISVSYKNSMADYKEDVQAQEPLSTALRIGFNPKLLIEGLKAFDCDNVLMEFIGASMPITIKAEDSDMTAIILPVKIKEA